LKILNKIKLRKLIKSIKKCGENLNAILILNILNKILKNVAITKHKIYCFKVVKYYFIFFGKFF